MLLRKLPKNKQKISAGMWGYEHAAVLGVYQKVDAKTPASQAKMLAKLAENENGELTLYINDDIINAHGIKVQHVNIGPIENFQNIE